MSSSEIVNNVSVNSINTDEISVHKIDLNDSYQNGGFVSTEEISYPSEHFQISRTSDNLENCANTNKSFIQEDVPYMILALKRTSDQDEASSNSSINVISPLVIDGHNRNTLNKFFFGTVPQIESEIQSVSPLSTTSGLVNILEEPTDICETLHLNKVQTVLVPSSNEIENSQNVAGVSISTISRSQFSILDQTNELLTCAQAGNQSSCHRVNATHPGNVILTSYENTVHADMVPDLLNSHVSTSYLTFPSSRPNLMRPPNRINSNNHNFFRPPFCRPAFRNRRRVARDRIPEESHKSCCGMIMNQNVSIRWFILMIAFVGLCCVVVGIVLGALKGSSGVNSDDHITVALLMIGVGIVLITVSGVAWRLTSHDAPTCCTMLGVNADPVPEVSHRFRPRVHNPYNRSQHPFGAMLYPEFQYSPPPPSYQASMQDYRLRLLLSNHQTQPVNSPPPTYRSTLSNQRPPLPTVENQGNASLPPSYRSRASITRTRPTLETMGFSTLPSGSNRGHSRNPSLTLSHLSHDSMFLGSAHSYLLSDNTHNASENSIQNNRNNTVDRITSIELPDGSETAILNSIPTISAVIGIEVSSGANVSANNTVNQQDEDLDYL